MTTENHMPEQSQEENAKHLALRTLAEETLLKQKRQFDNLVSKIPVGIYILHSTPAGTSGFDYVSPKMAEIFGVSVEEILADSKIPYLTIHPEEQETFVKLNKERIRHPQPFDWQGRALIDGSIKWLHIESTPELLENGDVLWNGIVTDITDRKRADDALRETEERYHNLLDVAPVGIAVQSEGRIVFTNPAGLKLLGAESFDQLIGKPISEIIHPAGFEKSRDRIRRMMAGEQGLYPAEDVYLRLDGTPIAVEVVSTMLTFNNKPAAQVIVTDITERKKTEEKLRELSQAIEQSPVSIVITDPSGSIEYVNSKFVNVTGYSYDEVIGQNPRILKSGHTRPEEYSRLWQTIKAGGEWHGEFLNRKKNGDVFWESAKISPIINGLGQTTHFLAVKEDITARKQAEDHVRRMEEQIRQSQKMDAIGQLAGGIAHDFNNVLGGIIGYTDMSLSLAEKGSVLESNLLKVLKASDRAKHLVKQILTFSRRGNPQRSAVTIRPILQEVLELLRASIPSSVIIDSDLNKNTKPVLADPTKLHEAILNLATNAVQAMKRKGTLTVRLRPVSLDHIEYGRSGEILPGDYTVIEIADTGCGMDSTVLSKAFEPFFTTKPVGEGTGMGLSVVLGVVQTHDGDIQIESEVGAGTTVRIYLPVSDDPIADAADENVRSDTSGTERILLVDDEPLLLEMVEEMLSTLGYSIVSMSDSVKALAFIRANSKEIDLLITDQTMPGLTGSELAAEALKFRNDLPIILCTGYSSEVNSEQAAAMGVSRFLLKPYRSKELSKSIREVLDNKSSTH
jgi:PAS domain S-box-containing protein